MLTPWQKPVIICCINNLAYGTIFTREMFRPKIKLSVFFSPEKPEMSEPRRVVTGVLRTNLAPFQFHILSRSPGMCCWNHRWSFPLPNNHSTHPTMASGYGAGSAVIDHPSKISANHCGDGSYDMVPLSSSPPSQTTVQCPEIIVLPNELWSRAFLYLDQNDLSMIGGMSRIFLSLSSADSMWEAICHQ